MVYCLFLYASAMCAVLRWAATWVEYLMAAAASGVTRNKHVNIGGGLFKAVSAGESGSHQTFILHIAMQSISTGPGAKRGE